MNAIQTIAKERETINDTIRSFFKDRGYLEVETPILVKSPGMEPNLTPFETIVREPNKNEYRGALITSPEYSMKKLLGHGLEKIFTLTKVFRNDEQFGGSHNPEFTMLEWYQQGADYMKCIEETETLVKMINIKLQMTNECQMTNFKWERKRVRDLFLQYVGIDLDAADRQTLFDSCLSLRIHTSLSDTESDLFYRLFLEKIEPNLLGNIFVYDYPKYQASLSRLTSDGKYGERFELYMNGLELCNGFTELTDANEQRKRFEEEAEERKQTSKTVHPIDEGLLSLLPSLRTPTFGNALGVDRLHMILTDRTKIEDVLLFPADKLFRDY
ncbi:EF-P lysine aminoacylase GenX [Candidatus Falkowbacteria bacterium]|nr:EF-P lysine aminoacylase GenX [Candidatus Falkowbacteria bacterium]